MVRRRHAVAKRPADLQQSRCRARLEQAVGSVRNGFGVVAPRAGWSRMPWTATLILLLIAASWFAIETEVGNDTVEYLWSKARATTSMQGSVEAQSAGRDFLRHKKREEAVAVVRRMRPDRSCRCAAESSKFRSIRAWLPW